MTFIKISACEAAEEDEFHEIHPAYDLAVAELSGCSGVFGLVWLHEFQHPTICAFLETLSPAAAADWEESVRNDFLRADAGVTDDYFDDPFWDDMQEQTWAAEESIKITAAAAYAANNSCSRGPCEGHPNPTPKQQTGGSDDDAEPASSDDHDSHVLAYLQHIKSLICWTSALEVIAAIVPASKSVQKHIYRIGNFRLELADYPADFTPDYTPPTLLLAARLHGYRGDCEQLYSLLDSNAAACRALFRKFARPLTINNIADQVVVDGLPAPSDQLSTLPDDLTLRMKIIDPDGWCYRVASRVASRMLAGWEKDPHYDDMCDRVVSLGYTNALRNFKPWLGVKFGTFLSVCMKTEVRDAIKSTHIYETSAAIRARLANILLPKLLSIRVDKCVDPDVTRQNMATLVNSLQSGDVSRDVVQMIVDLQKCVPDEHHALLDDITDAIVGMARGYHVVPTDSLNINTDDPDADDRQYYLRDIMDDDESRSPVDVTERKDQSVVVEFLLGTLKDGLMREVFVSKHVDELKTGEIADLYGITQDNVRKYLSKARAIMQEAAAAHSIRSEHCY